MLNNLKALFTILPIAVTMFILAKPLCLRFMAESDYVRRRNTWLALTVAAFAIPNFWAFVAAALAILVWSTRKERNPTALYLLILLALPPIGLYIPTVIINQLFELTYYRLLSIAILMPAAWRLLQQKRSGRNQFATTDFFIIGFGLYHLVLLMPYESFTHTIRRGVLFTIDALVLYYVASRDCNSRRAIVEALACFCLSCAIAVPLAVFESARTWLLYTGLGSAWGETIDFAYIFRSGTLRAQVAAGHSIALGYVLSIGFGFWLYLYTRVQRPALKIFVALWLWAGMIAAYARAPWLVAVVIFFCAIALGPKGSMRAFLAATVGAVLFGALLASPMGDRVIDTLPFVGTVDSANVTYRQRLAEAAWELIKMNPLFGTPGVLFYLESLRQGQGIIDLVNVYATIAMFYGLVGLVFFLGFFLVGLWWTLKRSRQASHSDPDVMVLGAALAACMLGTLFMMGTGSFGTSLVVMYWMLPGLAMAYAQPSIAGESSSTAPLQPVGA